MSEDTKKYWSPGEFCTKQPDGSYSDEALHKELLNIPPEVERRIEERNVQMAMRQMGYTREEAEKIYGPGMDPASLEKAIEMFMREWGSTQEEAEKFYGLGKQE